MPDALDADLLDRFLRGEQDAFERLFRMFGREVYGWSLKVVRDPSVAEDVVIEAFWRAYRGRGRFDPSRSFGAWMRRIATNAALDQLRAEATWKRKGPADPGVSGPPVGRNVTDAVALALRRLSPKLRIVATLAFVEEESYAEIADALDVPLGTVKSRVFRATRALRQELARLGFGDD